VGADEGEAVRALLGVRGEDEEGGVVFEGEELEGWKYTSVRVLEQRDKTRLREAYRKHPRRGGCRSSS
jgi:hypothetical protein